MKKAPEQYRLKNHIALGSTRDSGNNGFFIIPHYKIDGYQFNCMISDGEGWEHVSITISSRLRKVERCPTWQEMCFIKDIFWAEDELVLQYHPPKSEHVNNHPYCLHLWKPVGVEVPAPPSIMVGFKN